MTQEAEALIAKLSPGRAGKLPLVAGPLCLNFTNTASGRGDVSHQDHLQHYNDLLAWSLHAGALPIDEATELARLARRQPEAADQVLRRAVALRESLHAIGTAIAAHAAPPPEAVAQIDQAMTEATQAGRMRWTGTGFVWELVTHPPRLERPLWPILRSAGEVLLSAPLDRVKACAGQHCGWLFLDETRNGKRRWCEMEVCGSRAKMRRYRKRHSSKTA